MMRILTVFSIFLLSLTISSTAYSVIFSYQDLVGLWYGHQIVTGDAPGDDPRWGFGTVSIQPSGSFTASWNNPTHTGEVSSGAFQLSPTGTFTIDNLSLKRGVVGDSKNIMVVMEGTSSNLGNGLTILFKRDTGASFTPADLEGSWYGHHLVSGDNPVEDPRWGYGNVVINGGGSYTASWTSPTQSNQVSSGTIQMDSNGIFMLNNQQLTHGVMNNDKDMMVFIDGTANSGGNMLSLLFKRSREPNFSAADFSGFWNGYHVVSGDDPPDDPRWGYGSISFDPSANYVAHWNSQSSSNEISSGVIQISPDGLFTINNQHLTHGVINDSGDCIVFIDGTPQSGGNALTILLKHVAGTMSGANLLLLQ